jgi:hypothetical protein
MGLTRDSASSASRGVPLDRSQGIEHAIILRKERKSPIVASGEKGEPARQGPSNGDDELSPIAQFGPEDRR